MILNLGCETTFTGNADLLQLLRPYVEVVVSPKTFTKWLRCGDAARI